MYFVEIFGLVIAVAIALFIGFLLSFAITSGNEKVISENVEEYDYDDGIAPIETYAEVIDMKCGTKMVGVKSPKSVECYIIMFRDYLGETFEVSVNKEMYDGFEIGMHGNLKLVDGELYSFEV